MRPSRKALLSIAIMLWQTLAWMTPFAVQAYSEQFTHMAVHQQGTDHHHDDESLHLSSDTDSALHLHADNGFQPAGMNAWAAHIEIPPLVSTPVARQSSEPPTVFLDGLLRPPCAHA
ncbi:hypothetical protein AZ34_02450 [Hylemonella gracilis str. Niagara R]|uniref:Uncharacterized protein n=1 Tax=Hylemonella gracilis str. Niagara R TaxID=1458275 RepID=A0A016XNG5_9BURK|nr:hypothetical protein [Hylemonella gracilis]EYC52763.1 hypothetical protein AZ34_02450 [Hylemonella gracilis str. Niagara R]